MVNEVVFFFFLYNLCEFMESNYLNLENFNLAQSPCDDVKKKYIEEILKFHFVNLFFTTTKNKPRI